MKHIEKPFFEGLVLVCDDDNMSLMVICEHLLDLGLVPIIAKDGAEGVEKVQKRAEITAALKNGASREKAAKQFDIILMDIHMPVMNGLEASERINKIESSIPIIALTTDSTYKHRNIYIDSGIVDYLSKPYTPQELWHCLLNHLKPVVKKEVSLL